MEVKFETYPEYKDSGVDWLGEIPSGWKVVPGFTVVSERKEKNVGMARSKVLSLSYGKVIVKPKEKLTGLVPESFETYQFVDEGNIIIRPTDMQNDHTSLRTGLAKDQGIITSAYLNLEVSDKYCERFNHYYLHSIDTNKVIYGLGSGLRQNLDYRDFKRFPFLDIPKDEQIAIANFLDDKVSKIDEAIAQKEQLIQLLNERKQIIIQNAVTKGLNPNVPMRDSGIEWIGQIPEHWEVKKGHQVIKERNDKNTGMKTTNILSLSYGRIIKRPEEKMTGLVPESFESYQLVSPNNIIVRCTDLQNDKVSLRFGISKLTGAITSAYLNLHIVSEDLPDFIYLFLHTTDLVKEIYKYGSGLRQNLSYDDFKHMEIVIPPANEQAEIVGFILKSSEKILETSSQTKAQINKLKEYKASLINSAVTGKIKVSNDGL